MCLSPALKAPFWAVPLRKKSPRAFFKSTFKEAIDRGLRNNLGLLLASDRTESARGQRWRELSELLPNIGAHVN